MSGCKVIARTEGGGIEVVNSHPVVTLCKKVRRFGQPVVVVAGLYKVWPTEVYNKHKWFAIGSQETAENLLNGILHQDDVDWIITERGRFSPETFGATPEAKPFFEVQAIEVLCALSACPDDEALRQEILQHVDEILDELSVGRRIEEESGPLPHQEVMEWWTGGRLPDHFRLAQRHFVEKLRDEQWYNDNEGKYVGVVLQDEQVEFVVDEDEDALLRVVYGRWGYRPIFTALVTRDERPTIMRPRYKTYRMKQTSG